MLTPATSKVREFLGSWKNLLALGTLPVIGAWVFSRVWMVNPAILGDEYLYSMNARKVGPWDPPVAGDFSNYLFNFVYQGTNLCGEAFYTCGKVFNIVFFLGFILTLFVVACRFLPFWAAYGYMVAAALSPLNIYTSMFLPESMYFFLIGLVLVAVLRAMEIFNWQNWALAGVLIGVASLVKPHAWLSAVAVGIALLVVGLGSSQNRIQRTFRASAALVFGAALGRIVFGFIVAGPKALAFFGQYLGSSTLEDVSDGVGLSGSGSQGSSGITPLGGVVELFVPQLNTHLLTVSSLMAIGVVGAIAGVLQIFRSGELKPVTAFSLFALIWLATMILEIVMFTGWVTGSGDDHSTRVLIRYYDFLFVVVPLAGVSALSAGLGEKTNALFRWGLAAFFFGLITPAFTGFFASLTVQIADAPALAGLITNQNVFQAAALIGFASLLTFAAFPRFAKWVFVMLLPLTMVATGFQTQAQYQFFRAFNNPADNVGQLLRQNLEEDQLSRVWVVSTNRFEATNVAIWADNVELKFDLFFSGSVIDDSIIPEGTEIVVVMAGLTLEGGRIPIFEGEGYQVLEVN